MAYIVRERFDDARTGCGAVIVKEGSVIGIGWNGFISGAIPEYDFSNIPEHKGPFMIHSEHNALLFRRSSDISGAIVYATRLPCGQCAPIR